MTQDLFPQHWLTNTLLDDGFVTQTASEPAAVHDATNYWPVTHVFIELEAFFMPEKAISHLGHWRVAAWAGLLHKEAPESSRFQASNMPVAQ